MNFEHFATKCLIENLLTQEGYQILPSNMLTKSQERDLELGKPVPTRGFVGIKPGAKNVNVDYVNANGWVVAGDQKPIAKALEPMYSLRFDKVDHDTYLAKTFDGYNVWLTLKLPTKQLVRHYEIKIERDGGENLLPAITVEPFGLTLKEAKERASVLIEKVREYSSY